MQKIVPFLWYESDAMAVARYYRNIFGSENVQIEGEDNFEDTPSGQVQVVGLTLFGTRFRLMSAGRHHEFNDAVSFEVSCQDQDEIDTLWSSLTADGGQESQCGWCMDKYGVRWQIVPYNMNEIVNSPETMQKMLTMKKIIIADFARKNG